MGTSNDLNLKDTNEPDTFELEVSDTNFGAAVEYGVHDDHLNVGNLTFWSVAGIVFFVGLIIFGFNYYYFQSYQIGQEVSFNSEYKDLKNLKESEAEALNSYGIVDLDAGVYQIPVDQAVDLVLKEYSEEN